MPPLTDEFIEALKQDLKANPIEIEQAHATAAGGNNNSPINQWRNWQHVFDKSCMDWDAPKDFVAHLEMAVRNGSPDHPIVVKGTPGQQMGILLAVWYVDPDLLLKYYGILQSYIRIAKNEMWVGQHLNMVCDNRKAIVAILQFADKHHLGSGATEILPAVLKEAQHDFPGRKYDQVVAYWWTYMPEEIVDTLRMRVSGFIKHAAYSHKDDKPTELYVPDLEPDLKAFFKEMWKQCPDTTIEYAEDLRRSMVGKVLRKLPLSSDERERLCVCGQTLGKVLYAIHLEEVSIDDAISLGDYRKEFPLREIYNSSINIPDTEPSSRNELQGPNAVLQWNDNNFSIVWRDNVKISLQKSQRIPMIQRAVEKLIEWYDPDNPGVDIQTLCKVIGCSDPKYAKIIGTYKEAECLIIRVPGSRWDVCLNI
jgi:hypothetical protein